MVEVRGLVASKVGREEPFTREEWALEKEMEEETMVKIAVVRWLHHKERCNMDHGKRRRLNTTILMRRLERRLQVEAGSRRKPLE